MGFNSAFKGLTILLTATANAVTRLHVPWCAMKTRKVKMYLFKAIIDGFGEEKNTLPLPAFEPRAGQPVVGRYTDYATLPPDM